LKTKQSRVRKPKESKVRTVALSESSKTIFDPSGLKLNPTNEKWRHSFIHKMLEWAKLPTSVDLMEFCEVHDLPRQTFYDWVAAYEDIAKAYKHMQLIFASHRRRGAMFKRLEPHSAFRGIEFYDEEEMRNTLLAAEIKAKIAQAGVSEPTTFVINYNKPRIVSPEELKETVDATL